MNQLIKLICLKIRLHGHDVYVADSH